jgi:hypothetical protein
MGEYREFYGLRDFYHLIKQVSKGLASGRANSPEAEAQIVKRAIFRNFGGLVDPHVQNGAPKFSELFGKEWHNEELFRTVKEDSVIDLVKQNL